MPIGEWARADRLSTRSRLPRPCSPRRVAPRSGGLGGTSFTSFCSLRTGASSVLASLPSVERLCGPRKLIGGRGSRRWEGRAGAGVPRRMVRCAVADWPGAPLLAPAVPRRGIPRKKWPVLLGCRGLLGPPDGVWGRKNGPRDNGREFRGARPR
jgi:hypothetical protein